PVAATVGAPTSPPAETGVCQISWLFGATFLTQATWRTPSPVRARLTSSMFAPFAAVTRVHFPGGPPLATPPGQPRARANTAAAVQTDRAASCRKHVTMPPRASPTTSNGGIGEPTEPRGRSRCPKGNYGHALAARLEARRLQSARDDEE